MNPEKREVKPDQFKIKEFKPVRSSSAHKSALIQKIRSVNSLIKQETNVEFKARAITPRLVPAKRPEKSTKKKIYKRSLSGSRSVSLSRIL